MNYNNPVRALYDEAKCIWGESRRSVGCILSIGTGVPALRSTGNNGKSIVESLAAIATDTQQTADEFAAEIGHLPRTVAPAYFRFNVDHGLQSINLEEWKDFEALSGATDYYLNTHKLEIDMCVDTVMELGGT